jgi:hypothetical protein
MPLVSLSYLVYFRNQKSLTLNFDLVCFEESERVDAGETGNELVDSTVPDKKLACVGRNFKAQDFQSSLHPGLALAVVK